MSGPCIPDLEKDIHLRKKFKEKLEAGKVKTEHHKLRHPSDDSPVSRTGMRPQLQPSKSWKSAPKPFFVQLRNLRSGEEMRNDLPWPYLISDP